MGFGSLIRAPTVSKPKVAKPKKPKMPSMAYRGVSQQHLGGPYQAPEATPTSTPAAADDEAGSGGV